MKSHHYIIFQKFQKLQKFFHKFHCCKINLTLKYISEITINNIDN